MTTGGPANPAVGDVPALASSISARACGLSVSPAAAAAPAPTNRRLEMGTQSSDRLIELAPLVDSFPTCWALTAAARTAYRCCLQLDRSLIVGERRCCFHTKQICLDVGSAKRLAIEA